MVVHLIWVTVFGDMMHQAELGQSLCKIPAFGGSVGNFDSQGSYDLVIKIKPDDPNFVLIGGTNLYRSTDGFSTSTSTKWIGGYSPANNVSQYPYHHPDQHAISFLPGSNIVTYSGHDGGISKTTDITTSYGKMNQSYGRV